MAYPTLNQNEIYSALSNMIISQQVFSDRITDKEELVDKAKTDGGLFGDTKLFYSADVLTSHEWGNDAEATNLLALDRPNAPETEAIVLDKFRQIRLTLDDYLSNRAWSSEGSFGQFNALMESMLTKTKRIYEVTGYNTFIGTEVVVDQIVEIDASEYGSDPSNEGKVVAEKIANLITKMTDVSRDYNEYHHITKFDKKDLIIVWNEEFVNKIKKVDLPVIYHKDGMFEEFKYVMPSKYFGERTSQVVTAVQNTGGYKSMIEKVYTKNGTKYHYFAGEEIIDGVEIAAGEAYVENANIICKVFVKLPPHMSAFSAGTTFFNPRSLTTNRYLTWGHNTLKHLKAYPCVSVELVTD